MHRNCGRTIITLLMVLVLVSCVGPTPRPKPQKIQYNVYLPAVRAVNESLLWGIGASYGDCAAIKQLVPENGWFYTWGLYPDPCPGIEAVPMIWDSKTLGLLPSGGDVILWFNEPDQEMQANMNPQIGGDYWNEYRPVYDEFENGSPAVSDPDWLDQFLALVDVKPDFLCAHIYESQCDIAEAKRRFLIHLDRFLALSRKWDIPLWITEYAWVTSSPDIIEFIVWSKCEIEKHPEIQRAAWFQTWYRGDERWAVLPNTSLANSEGTINELGKAYRETKCFD